MAKNLKKLVIVESPAKARKIGGYLGDDFIVEASVGHIRDLPQRAADIPKEVKKLAWSKEGVDIENDFAPLYVINPDKKAKVAELKELMKLQMRRSLALAILDINAWFDLPVTYVDYVHAQVGR